MGVQGGGQIGGGLGGAGGAVPPPPGALTSFAGRLGPAILPQFADYTAALIVDTSDFATANVELALNAAKALAESKAASSPIDGILYGQLNATLTPITSANISDATAGLGPLITDSLATLNTTKLSKSPIDGDLYGQIDGINTLISSANIPDATVGLGPTITISLGTLRTGVTNLGNSKLDKSPIDGVLYGQIDGVLTQITSANVGADPAGTAAAAVAAHVALPDPHPQYTTAAEAAALAPVQSVNGQTGAVTLDAIDVGADSAGTAAAAVAAHVALADPHPQYTTAAELAAALAAGTVPLDYHANERFTPAASTGPGLITYLTLSFTAVGGVYFLAGVGGLTGSSSTTQIRAALVIDGVSQGGPYLETGINNGVFVLGTPSRFPFSPGPHTVELAFEHAGGPGTTTSNFAVLQVWKVA